MRCDLAIRGGRVLTPEGFQDSLDVGALAGRIVVLGSVEAEEEVDAGGLYVLPGFVDTHLHGAGGSADPESMARFLPSTGVTAFLPTLAASSAEDTLAFVASVAELVGERGAAEILGSHLEGPYLSHERCGAQPPEHLRPPDVAEVERLLAAAAGSLRRVTLAPELAGVAEVVRRLADAGVDVSLGHSACSYELAREAVRWGARAVTHTYNAMAPFRHRAPGLVGAAFTCEELTAELIADGVHVHPAAALALLRARGPAGVAVVSDGLPPLGLPPGVYDWAGRAITSDARVAWLRAGDGGQVAGLEGGAGQGGPSPSLSLRGGRGTDRTASGRGLAGSVTTLLQALRNLVEWGVPFAEAARALSSTPAGMAGAGGRKGSIAVGYDADLLLLDSNLGLIATYCRGQAA